MPHQTAAPEAIRFEMHLLPDEARHIAQFLKRACFTDFLNCSVDQDEAYAMKYACERLSKQLVEQGFAPR